MRSSLMRVRTPALRACWPFLFPSGVAVLLKRSLALADIKRMLLGHWGKTPGQNFI